ncbi:MAG: GNAT family N-acetyltransferase [Christensenella sp.]
MEQELFETERMTFCKFTSADKQLVSVFLQDEEVMYAWEHGFSDTETEDWCSRNFKRYEKYGCGWLNARDKKTGASVGAIGLIYNEDINGEAGWEIGYILNKAFWGKGYAVEGARGCTKYLFDELGAERVIAQMRVNNVSSRMVAKKIGMKYVGTYNRAYNNMQLPHDIYMMEKQGKGVYETKEVRGMILAGRTAKWLNMPHQATITDEKIVLHAERDTDFWQNTYYGFSRNSGHALLTEVDEECSFSVKTFREGKSQYDQCGIIVYIDEKNWAKVCLEYEDENAQKLGSVVTRRGFSDWATEEVSGNIDTMYYRVSRRGESFLFEASADGKEYKQMRIFHLRCKNAVPRVGVFACAPTGEGFRAIFEEVKLTESLWQAYKG